MIAKKKTRRAAQTGAAEPFAAKRFSAEAWMLENLQRVQSFRRYDTCFRRAENAPNSACAHDPKLRQDLFPWESHKAFAAARPLVAPSRLLKACGNAILYHVALAGVLALRAARPVIPGPGIAPAGLVLFIAVLSATPTPPFAARLWRATVYGLHSGRDPGREEMKSVILSARSPEERSLGIGMWVRFGPKK